MCKPLFAKLLLLAGAILPFVIGQQVGVDFFNPAPDAHGKKVYENTLKIKLELTLDREVYLPGEAMRITMAAWNSTNETLEVFDPLNETVLDYLHWDEGRLGVFENWTEIAAEPPSMWHVNWSGSTVTLAPGQRIEKQDVEGKPLASDDAPKGSGKFMLCYGYLGMLSHCAQAVFTVEQATVVHAASVKLETRNA